MKKLIWICGFYFVALLFITIVYFKERVLYVDSAFYAFNFINNEFPAAEHSRYSLYIYQIIPWIALKLGFPLSIVLRLYSFSHVFVHFIFFIILIKIKQPKLAILVTLIQFISYRECFFLTVNETALSLSFTLLFIGIINTYNHTKEALNFALLFLCVLFSFFSHPMSLVVLCFALGYFFVENIELKKQFKIKSIFTLATMAFVLAFISKKLLSESTGYENNLYDQLKNVKSIISNLSNIYPTHFFFDSFKWQSYFMKMYWIPSVIFLVLMLLFIWKKQWFKLIYYVLSVIGLWILTAIIFNQGDGNIFMEKNFTPWVFITLLPLFLVLNENWINNNSLLLSSILIFIGFYSFYGISNYLPIFQKRVYLMDELITTKNPEKHQKLLLHDSTLNHDEWLGTWALPYETLLLSKIKKMPTITAKVIDKQNYDEKLMYNNNTFIGADFFPILTTEYVLKNPEFKMENKPYVWIKY